MRHNLPGTDIHAFAQDPGDPGRLFALVAGAGVFSSTDGGATWSSLAAQPPGGAPIALATNGSILYAATGEGIAASPDRGGTWEMLASQPDGGSTWRSSE